MCRAGVLGAFLLVVAAAGAGCCVCREAYGRIPGGQEYDRASPRGAALVFQYAIRHQDWALAWCLASERTREEHAYVKFRYALPRAEFQGGALVVDFIARAQVGQRVHEVQPPDPQKRRVKVSADEQTYWVVLVLEGHLWSLDLQDTIGANPP